MRPGEEFRRLMQIEFTRRCGVNPRYSLRAYARFLAIDPSTLSQILRGRRPITRKFAEMSATKLGLSAEERAKFAEAFADSGRRRKRGEVDARELSIDTFHVIAEWHHMAIFALASVDGFQAAPEYAARRLGIPKREAVEAIGRLVRLGLLVRAENGKLRQGSSVLTTVGNPFTDRALKALQIQFLELAKKALEETPIDERDQSTLIFSVPRAKLPEIKSRIKKFRRSLLAYAERSAKHDEVLALGISLFPLACHDRGK